MPTDSQLTHYFQAVNEGYEALLDAIESSRGHGEKIWDQLLQEVRAGQKEALVLGERLATNSTDPKAYSTLLESSLKAQERSLAFAKVIFEEASGIGTDGRTAFERVFAANRTATQAAIEITNRWTGQNAFADAWRKGVEAMTGMAAAAAPRS